VDERIPWSLWPSWSSWWPLLSVIGGSLPILVVGVAIATDQLSLSVRWEREKERLRGVLPEWFPDWLYQEATPRELEEYSELIRHGAMTAEDFERIPETVYHVTANAPAILREGFKTAAELGFRDFGGTGNYVSVTTLENARIYRDNMRMACRLINGLATLRELREWMVKAAAGSEATFRSAFETARFRFKLPEDVDLDDPRVNTPEFLWEVFSLGFALNGPGYALFIGKPTLLGKRPEDIVIVEAEVLPGLRFRHPYNIIRPEDVAGRYTYNKYEKEWRIWQPKYLKPLRVVDAP